MPIIGDREEKWLQVLTAGDLAMEPCPTVVGDREEIKGLLTAGDVAMEPCPTIVGDREEEGVVLTTSDVTMELRPTTVVDSGEMRGKQAAADIFVGTGHATENAEATKQSGDACLIG